MEGNMLYNISNYDKLSLLYFHDGQLKDIHIDYENKIIQIIIKKCDETKTLIKIKFVYFSMECFEPWGEGIYIDSHYSTLEKSKNQTTYIKFDILLNSGDKMSVIASEIEI